MAGSVNHELVAGMEAPHAEEIAAEAGAAPENDGANHNAEVRAHDGDAGEGDARADAAPAGAGVAHVDAGAGGAGVGDAPADAGAGAIGGAAGAGGMLDLQALKAQRARLKRELKECSKTVKAQARFVLSCQASSDMIL